MLDNKGLTETQQVTNLLHVASVNDCVVNQITLLLLCLLSQNVTVVSVCSLNLTCTGEAESLLRSGICLYFWHFFNVLIYCCLLLCGNAYTGRYALCLLVISRRN